jgi:hypothetical protein
MPRPSLDSVIELRSRAEPVPYPMRCGWREPGSVADRAWGASPHFAAGAKDQFEETDDATNVLREHPRDNGRPAIWSEIGHQPSLAAVKSTVLRITQLHKPSSLSSFTLRNIIRNSPGVLQSSSTPHIGLTDAAIPPLLAGASRVNGV